MFFIINKTTRAVIRVSETPFNIDENVQPGGEVIQLKRVDDKTKPTFDPATQKLVKNFADDDKTFTRIFKWEVVSLTNGELAQRTQELQDEANRVQIKAVANDLKNGVGTNAERLVRLEKVVAYLLRNEVRR